MFVNISKTWYRISQHINWVVTQFLQPLQNNSNVFPNVWELFIINCIVVFLNIRVALRKFLTITTALVFKKLDFVNFIFQIRFLLFFLLFFFKNYLLHIFNFYLINQKIKKIKKLKFYFKVKNFLSTYYKNLFYINGRQRTTNRNLLTTSWYSWRKV
jgi:hypothetical protein